MHHASPSLSFDCTWIDEPTALDPLERRTWTDLRIYAGGRCLTRVFDRETFSERTSIFVPALPIAEWLIANWWQLLYEPCRGDAVPSLGGFWTVSQRDWLRRHCIRSAAAGLLLPRAFIYSDGRNVCVEWQSDHRGSYPQMPAEFVGNDAVFLPVERIESGLRSFIREVLDRIASDQSTRSHCLQESWQTICDTDPNEASFCRAAGRLGVDPYTPNLSGELVLLLEEGMSQCQDQPIGIDFLESVMEPQMAPAAWNWIDEVVIKNDLRASPSNSIAQQSSSGENPWTEGYGRAKILREAMQQSSLGPIGDLSDAASAADIEMPEFLEFEPDSSQRGQLTVVGWAKGSKPRVIGPTPPRLDNRRFWQARSLYHAVFTCQEGPRLSTSARTWDQKASRAFAAELLAPRAGILEELNADQLAEAELDSRLTELAAKFNVSTRVIELQLNNARIG